MNDISGVSALDLTLIATIKVAAVYFLSQVEKE